MARTKLTAEEWETFLRLADRLGIPVRELLDRKVRFTEMESAGHQLGRAVAQITAERMMGPQACPTCGKACPVRQRERELTTVDGPLGLIEPVAHCLACRGDFFPQRVELGLDRRSCSPLVIDKIVFANGEHKSLGKTQKMLRKLAEISVSISLIEDYTREIGGELSAHKQPQAKAHAAGALPSEHAEPQRAVALWVDGGRIMTRAEGTRGVHSLPGRKPLFDYLFC